jgi:hypothetical protein
MAARQKTQQPAAKTLRLFGWCIALCLAVVGQLFSPLQVSLWLQLAGAAVFAVATVRPSAMRPVVAGLLFIVRPFPYLGGWFAKTGGTRRPPTQRSRIADTGA